LEFAHDLPESSTDRNFIIHFIHDRVVNSTAAGILLAQKAILLPAVLQVPMDGMALFAAVLLGDGDGDTLLQLKGFCCVDFELVGGADEGFDGWDDGGFEFAGRESVEEGEVGGEFVDLGGEVFVSERGHARVVGFVGEDG
jgi:hypothetical protein